MIIKSHYFFVREPAEVKGYQTFTLATLPGPLKNVMTEAL